MSTKLQPFSPIARSLLIAASLFIVIAGLKATASILTPIILAMFFSIILAPILYWLKRKRLPTWLALLIMIIGLIVVGLALIGLITLSINQFANNTATYQASLQERLTELQASLAPLLANLGLDPSTMQLPGLIDPQAFVQSIAGILTGLGGTVINAMLLLLIIVFMMLEAANLPAKLQVGLGTDNTLLAKFAEFSTGIKNYVLARTYSNLFTGGLITVMLWVMGVELAFLWGFLAFLLSYIPYIGLILAAIPAVLLAWLQFGITAAIVVIIGYTVINILAENLVSPKLMGQGLKLSVLVVFLSFIFWGWLLGFVGTLLAAPLTVLLKIILESSDDTRWMAIVLGSDVPGEETVPNAEPA